MKYVVSLDDNINICIWIRVVQQYSIVGSRPKNTGKRVMGVVILQVILTRVDIVIVD